MGLESGVSSLDSETPNSRLLTVPHPVHLVYPCLILLVFDLGQQY